VLVAASGGGDSTALLALLAGLAPGRGFDVVVATLDHGLRGREGAADRAFVEALCEAWSVPVRAARRVPERSGEAEARRVRHAFLLEAARDAGADAIALGHTLDDQVETLLHRLGRGAGTTGLASMARWAPPLWRPLLAVRRRTLRDVLERAGIAWREDATNDDARFTRTRVRRDVVPALVGALGDSALEAAGRAADLLRDDEECLRGLAAQAAAELIAREDGADGLRIDARGLRRLPPALSRRVVRDAIAGLYSGRAELSAAHVRAVDELGRATGPGTTVHLPGGVRARRRDGAVHLQRTAPSGDPAGDTEDTP
jgi:tRNA(Ile)-lysidine synthase